MGDHNTQGFRDLVDLGICTMETALAAHLESGFYPPIPPPIRLKIIEAFKSHWAGEEITLEFAHRCGINSIEAVYKYFGPFINNEEEPS